MEHNVDALARRRAGLHVGNVGLDEAMPLPRRIAHQAVHFVEIGAVAGREVVEAGHALPGAQQDFDQMRADEARAPGHQPAARPVRQLPGDLVRHAFHKRQTLTPRSCKARRSAVHFTSA